MYLRRDQLTRTIRAPAKLNLYLEILGRRADGFHELETLMIPIGLSDFLTFTPIDADNDRGSRIVLAVREAYPLRSLPGLPATAPELKETNYIGVPTGADNLVVRALELLRERSGIQQGAKVELLKHIPAAAGLGGGSSDAAAALRIANRGWQLHWSRQQLMELAAELGSDVPFFLAGGAAVCRGRGERVERVRDLKPLDVVIVSPTEGLNTADVYRAHDALPTEARELAVNGIERVIANRGRRFDATTWLHNRLEVAATMLSPFVGRLRRAFADLDFVNHQLSGSGSAYFGICRHAQHAKRLAAVLRSQRLGLVYATRSCA